MTDKPDEPKIHQLPTAADEMAGAFSQMMRVWRQQRAHAEELAQTRKAMFDAYIRAGFTESQALELCKSMSL